MEAAGGPTSTLTAAASMAWCTSGGTGSAGVLMLLAAATAAVALWCTRMCVSVRWGAAWRRVMKVWRTTQESCDGWAHSRTQRCLRAELRPDRWASCGRMLLSVQCCFEDATPKRSFSTVATAAALQT